MATNSPKMLVSLFRCGRLALHICYGILLAIFHPHLDQAKQRDIVKAWSRHLLTILNIDIQINGHQPTRGQGGCLIVANHVSWLDIFVLNAIHPSQFIAKSDIRNWPIIGWLSRRSGTIFIERALRRGASLINQRVGHLLSQGACLGLFPEGTTTDGRQVGHFHSALFQPAIDAGIRLCPIALRYQNEEGHLSSAAAFTGEMTLVQSIWTIVRAPHLHALVIFTPALMAGSANRRVLARSARESIAQVLETIDTTPKTATTKEPSALPGTTLSSQSSYALLIDPLLNQLRK